MQVRSLLATTAATAAVGLLSSLPAQALTFGNTGIQFDQDTTIRFFFEGSNNFYQSNLSVYRVDSGAGLVEERSIFGESPGALTEISFVGGQTYTLALRNINPNDNTIGLSPIVFSTTALNTAANFAPNNPAGSLNPNIGQQRANFTGAANPLLGAVFIAFEDGGFDGGFNSSGQFVITQGNNADFNDFRVKAEVIPAPPLLLGLLAMGARVFSRQRKSVRA